jgi:predicted secreted hydrolase
VSRVPRALVVAGVVVVAAMLAWLSIREVSTPPSPSVSVAEALAARTDEGFAKALVPRPFVFPADHGPHPGFRSEWWYYTGNVATAGGRRFGYQLTFFRVALAPPSAPRRSAWATTESWMAHLAVTDIEGRRFVARSRLSRGGALELAGARATPFAVWLERWSARGLTSRATPAMRLAASDADAGIDLVLESAKPPVLEGDAGLSRKGSEPGQASYYYSLTRVATSGTITVGADRFDVSGTSWMDREWSTSALGRDQVGWDWFALQLDDGREVMLYRLRRADGSVDPASAGTLIATDGSSRGLDVGDVTVDVLGWWTSGGHGDRPATRYPARWRLAIPSTGLELEVTPRLADQEWTEPVRYWEGAVAVRGRARDRAIGGEGYVELVGYARTPVALAR